MKASYGQTVLYLTKVSVTDVQGNYYTDTTIVNVLDYTTADSMFKKIWTGMKEALINWSSSGGMTVALR